MRSHLGQGYVLYLLTEQKERCGHIHQVLTLGRILATTATTIVLERRNDGGRSPYLPLSKLIAYLKKSIVGLRGVTRGTMNTVVSPSTDLLGVQDKVGVTDIESEPVTSARQPVTSAREVSYVDDLFRNIVDNLRD
jgi:hypothetical protein